MLQSKISHTRFFPEKYSTDYDQVFAPVVKQSTVRILLSIAGNQNKVVRHMDAKTAFLNGNLKETIFMKQPPGYESDDKPSLVCQLKRSLYGLKQAAKSWNEAIHNELIRMGFTQANADPCLYVMKYNEDWCYIFIYVDDLIVASKLLDVIKLVRNTLSLRFEMQDLGDIKCVNNDIIHVHE